MKTIRYAVWAACVVAFILGLSACQQAVGSDPDATEDDGLDVTVELSAMGLSEASISPAFDPATTEYSASVPHELESVTVTLATDDSDLEVTVNGTAVLPGEGTATVNLDVGVNVITIGVSLGSESLTYTITVTRAAPPVELAGLSLSDAALSPAFDPAVTAYSANVGPDVEEVTVTPTVLSTEHEVTVNGTTVLPGDGSETVPVSFGENAITVEVTDGTDTFTYSVTVTRAAPPVELSGLSLSDGTLSPAFDPAVTDYTASVAYPVDSLTVSVEAPSSQLEVSVGEITVLPGDGAGTVGLVIGENPVAIAVSYGEDTTIYNVTVDRAAPSVELADISLSAGTLTPSFDPSVTDYTAEVSFETDSITVTVAADSPELEATINETQVLPGDGSESVNLSTGDNLIDAVVFYGEDSETYTVTVSRLFPDIAVIGPETFGGADIDLASGSTVDFGSVSVSFGDPPYNEITFSIQNQGTGTLQLTEPAPEYLSLTPANQDTDADDFTVVTQPDQATIPPSGSREFVVRLTANFPTGTTKEATLSINNDDEDEGDFTLSLTGFAVC
jgi:hypothetical protein